MKPFVIAEIGVNHNGSISKAIELINAAKESGASAVKFQTFSASRLASSLTPKVSYQKKYDLNRTHFEMLKSLELSFDDQEKLSLYCKSNDVEFLSTPYSTEDAIFLQNLGVDKFKIASADIVDLELIKLISSFGKTTLISTGMANMAEVKNAVGLFDKNRSNLILMHTTSEYPTSTINTNILRINTLRKLNPNGVGFSDHTLDSTGAIMSVALGCEYFEKHFTLSRADLGPDHATSVEPNEFKKYVNDINQASLALGNSNFSRTIFEEEMAMTSRKSLHFSRSLSKGHILTRDDFIFIRPGSGLGWENLVKFLGRNLTSNVEKGDLVDFKVIETSNVNKENLKYN